MNAATPRLPSIAQMANRSNSGHLRALRAFARSGHAEARPNITMGEWRGLRTVMDTLSRWECATTAKEGEVREQIGPGAWRIIERGEYVTRLTDRGVALLAALEEREAPRTYHCPHCSQDIPQGEERFCDACDAVFHSACLHEHRCPGGEPF